MTLKSFWALSLCLGLALSLAHCSKEERWVGSGLAPDFTLKTLQGEEVSLSKFRGKVVLLDFWATWCGPCREATPHLVQLYRNFKGKGLEVIGMSVDRGDMDAVRRFARSMEIPYPIVIAPDDVARSYGVVGIPTIVLIDQGGQIRDKRSGFSTAIAKQLASRVSDLTSQKPQ